MNSSRRQLIKNIGVLSLAPSITIQESFASMNNEKSSNLISSVDDRNGDHYLLQYDQKNDIIKQFSIAERGHEPIVNPNKSQILLISRRPGTQVYVHNIDSNDEPLIFKSKADRHFYGHAYFSDDGRYLFTTENDYVNDRGVIGIRDAQDNYRWLDEIDSGGIGCHELGLLSDGKTLVVANGGILTHPDKNRIKLNQKNMQPSLAYLDTEQGVLVDKFTLPDLKLSIRHLDIATDDTVMFGCQYEGDLNIVQPLVYFHKGESELQAGTMEDDYFWTGFENYTASVCQHDNGIVCVTAPRGNILSFWNYKNKQYLGNDYFRDVAGVAVSADNKHFICTNGRGEFKYYDAYNLSLVNQYSHHLAHLKWDNHLLVV